MSKAEPFTVDPSPARLVSIAVSAGLVLLWAFIRLGIFETITFPLTYVLPLLVCIWTRDRVALWCMAAAFAALHTWQIFGLFPPGSLTAGELWANYGATLSNIAFGATAVHIVIGLRNRLEHTLGDVRAQADELRTQSEELAQQNEELAEQSEELANQNEELQSQSEEIGTLNETLERRETLLSTLLDTARLSGGERAALQHIASAGLDLFNATGAAIVVYERTKGGLRVRALASPAWGTDLDELPTSADEFVDLVLHQQRTASLADVSLRPDLTFATLAGLAPFRAVLCAPIQFGGDAFGALTVYSPAPHEWTEEEFRLVDWLSGQCGRVLQALRVQSDLREADRRKSEFLATLSHELRNPLAPIGFALKLIEGGQGRESHPVRVMRRQLQQLVRLVDDLLDATRISSNKIQIRRTRTDLVPIVEHAIEATRADIDAARHTLVVTLPQQPVWLDADAERMAQVVTNLLNNASRYTPPGGRLTVTLTMSGNEILLLVADTGVGLEGDDLERVFEMFTQVGGPGSGGLGIGLALVKGIVELHGGRVEARSEGHGHGSEFRLTLPVAAGVPPEIAPGEQHAPVPHLGTRVLVVDDNRDSAEMIGAVLEMHGHEVCIAHDAERALAVAHEFNPDAALLDIGLPGLSGYELAQRLRQDPRTRNIRLIALTGWGQPSDRARAMEAGFDAHLTKPAQPEVILAAISGSTAI